MAEHPDEPAGCAEPVIGQIPLSVHAAVVAAQSEGFDLDQILIHERIHADAWEAGNTLWGEALLESAEGDLKLIEQHDAAVAQVLGRMRRHVLPLEENFGAWLALQQQLLAQSNPSAYLAELGLEPGDLLALSSQWTEKVVNDDNLRNEMAQKMSGPAGTVPPLEFGPKTLGDPANQGPDITLPAEADETPLSPPNAGEKPVLLIETAEPSEVELQAPVGTKVRLPWEVDATENPADVAAQSSFSADTNAGQPPGDSAPLPSREELWAMLGIRAPGSTEVAPVAPMPPAERPVEPPAAQAALSPPSVRLEPIGVAPSGVPQFNLPHVPPGQSSEPSPVTANVTPRFDLPQVPHGQSFDPAPSNVTPKFDLPQVPPRQSFAAEVAIDPTTSSGNYVSPGQSAAPASPNVTPRFDLPQVPTRQSSSAEVTIDPTTSSLNDVPQFEMPQIPQRVLPKQTGHGVATVNLQVDSAVGFEPRPSDLPPTVVPPTHLGLDTDPDLPITDKPSSIQHSVTASQVAQEPQLTLDLLALLESELEFFPGELDRIVAKHRISREQLEIDRSFWTSRCRLSFELNQSYSASLSSYREHWRMMASFR